MSKLWGGRFSKETDKVVEEFTESLRYDYKLAMYDLLGSITHVGILRNSGVLTEKEADSLSMALKNIFDSLEKGEDIQWDPNCEDIHSAIQNKLENKVSIDLLSKLHTARSRNDQVVFATKMYCKIELSRLHIKISKLIEAISLLGNDNQHIIIPGFTHLQHAQPVYLKDYLDAYRMMLERDQNRLRYIDKNLKISLGAGALAGTPISYAHYKEAASKYIKDLQLEEKFQLEAVTNSLDSVSDRDFVIEIISALSIVSMHLSRFSEDLILWSTKEFDFIELDEAYCTGSSLMPQKKNPDVLELIRGYAGRIYGNLVSVLTMMKGLPLTYNRDMQLDKEPLFNSFEIVSIELKVLTGLISSLKFNTEKINNHLKDESLYATDLVYYLVLKKKVPFKQAHAIIGELIKYSEDSSQKIKDMSEAKLKEFSEHIVKNEILPLFDAKVSVESKKSIKRDKDN